MRGPWKGVEEDDFGGLSVGYICQITVAKVRLCKLMLINDHS